MDFSWILLAQDDAMRLFGYTVAEWSALIVFLTALAETVRSKLKNARDGKKIAAVIEAIEEVAEAHPETVDLVKASAKRKATSYGVEVGKWGLGSGLHEAVTRSTLRLKNKNGIKVETSSGRLVEPGSSDEIDPYTKPESDPDAPTPDVDAPAE